MLKFLRSWPVAFAGLLLLPSSALAWASADGGMGPTSRTTIEIKVSVAPRFDVKRNLSPSGPASPAGPPLCIASNNGAAFSVTALDPSGASLARIPGTSLAPVLDASCGLEQLRILKPGAAIPIAGTGRAVLLLIAPE